MSSAILAARDAAIAAEEAESFKVVLQGFLSAASTGPGLVGQLLRWRRKGESRSRRGDGSLFPLPFVDDSFVDDYIKQEGDNVVAIVWVERRILLLQI